MYKIVKVFGGIFVAAQTDRSNNLIARHTYYINKKRYPVSESAPTYSV